MRRILILFTTLLPLWIVAQDTIPPDTSVVKNTIPPDTSVVIDTIPTPPVPKSIKTVKNGVEFYFKNQSVKFSQKEIISNVLVIRNTSTKTLKFNVDISIPETWKTFHQLLSTFEVPGNDSIFIPIHIIPKITLKGSTRFLFTANLIGEHNEQYGFTYFFGIIEKHVSWDINASENKVYLINGQTKAPFNVGIFNTGPDEQDIYLSINSLSRHVSILDSSGNNQAKLPQVFGLDSQKDTTIYYVFHKTIEKRNSYLIDMEGYNPFNNGEAQKYSVYINSTSPNRSEKNKFRAGDKINFLQLSNEWEANRYGSDVIPLVMDMTTYNILSDHPMMNLLLSGQTFFSDQSFLVYNTQMSYYSNIFSLNPYRNATYYFGYFSKKYDMQFGNINGGILGTIQNGEGLKGSYYINDEQKIGAFYTQTPRLFQSNPNYRTVGVDHDYKTSIFRLNTKVGYTANLMSNKDAFVTNINASTNYFKNHSFGVRLGSSRNEDRDSSIVKYGYYAGLYYSGRFLQKKLQNHISAVYFSPDFGIYGFERLSINAGNEYLLNDKWRIGMVNNYYRNPEIYNGQLTGNFFYQLNNQVNFTRYDSRIGNMNPNIFYNLSRIRSFNVQARGVGFNLGKYDFEKKYHYFINIRSGYNYSPDTLQQNFFFFRFGGLIQVKTLTFMTRYTLGNLSLSKDLFVYNSIKNPQTISLTLRHQYVFPFKSLVMLNAGSFMYSSLSGKNFNFIPELDYFTKRGWRLRIFAEINFYLGAKNNQYNIYYPVLLNSEIIEPHWTQDFYLSLGIRKEFGIPIPKTKKKFCTIKFIAFYDLNGDGKRNSGEDLIENVVIQTNNFEVITNNKGEAILKNLSTGKYLFNAFSIKDLKGWFPHINDTVVFYQSDKFFIPFTRGVKVTGKVFIQLDKFNLNSDSQMDLSHIKISMVNDKTFTSLTNNDGTFEIYVPLGKYVLTMDEKVLGERYQLLKNNFDLFIDDQFDNVFIPFYIVEKPKKVKIIKFDNNGNRIDK